MIGRAALRREDAEGSHPVRQETAFGSVSGAFLGTRLHCRLLGGLRFAVKTINKSAVF
jgi:hypothetical protein